MAGSSSANPTYHGLAPNAKLYVVDLTSGSDSTVVCFPVMGRLSKFGTRLIASRRRRPTTWWLTFRRSVLTTSIWYVDLPLPLTR
jgi:hypothetical protein